MELPPSLNKSAIKIPQQNPTMSITIAFTYHYLGVIIFNW